MPVHRGRHCFSKEDKVNRIKKVLFTAGSFFSVCAIAYAHEGHAKMSNWPIKFPWGMSGVTELKSLHPIIVHFPIVLLLLSIAGYWIGVVFKKENFINTSALLLRLGALATGVAVWTGLRAANTAQHDATTHHLMLAHQYLGIAVLSLSVLLASWSLLVKQTLPAKGKFIFLGLLLVLGAAMTQQADWGGRMVYQHGIGVGAKKMMEQMGEAHSDMELISGGANVTKKSTTLSNVAGVWNEIESGQEYLAQIIKAGQLDQVHKIAFKIRDIVKTLPGTGLTSDQKTVLSSSVKEIERGAGLLDEYGDAGDKNQTQSQFEKFSQTLQSIKSLYGESKEADAHDMSNMKM